MLNVFAHFQIHFHIPQFLDKLPYFLLAVSTLEKRAMLFGDINTQTIHLLRGPLVSADTLPMRILNSVDN